MYVKSFTLTAYFHYHAKKQKRRITKMPQLFGRFLDAVEFLDPQVFPEPSTIRDSVVSTVRNGFTSFAAEPTGQDGEPGSAGDDASMLAGGPVDESKYVKYRNATGYANLEVQDDGGQNFSLPNIGHPEFACRYREDGGADWGPAFSHPRIEPKKTFLEKYSDFSKRVATFHVEMFEEAEPDADEEQPNEEGAENPVSAEEKKLEKLVYWDADYPVAQWGQHWVLSSDAAVGGKRPRYWTPCPADDKEHTYKVRVTALDEFGSKIESFGREGGADDEGGFDEATVTGKKVKFDEAHEKKRNRVSCFVQIHEIH